MAFEDTMRLLEMMGITAEYFDDDMRKFTDSCKYAYAQQTLRLLHELKRWTDESVPREIEYVVDNWAAGYIIQSLRIQYPQLSCFVKYTSQGTDTTQFALRDGTKSLDPAAELMKVPPELARYRRAVPKIRDWGDCEGDW